MADTQEKVIDKDKQSLTPSVKEKKEEKSSLTPKLEKIAKEIEELSVLELSELVANLQERLGVSPQMAPAVPTGQAAMPQTGAPAEGEQTSGGAGVQTVVMTDSGANKIAVIKALREINPNLGLKEAKDMTDKVPVEIVKDVKAEEAKTAKEKLEAAGAKVELK